MDKKFDKSKLVEFLACPTGFEPATSRVGVLRAIQLCHGQMCTCLFYQILRVKSIHNSKKSEIFKNFFIIPIDFYIALC